tara:strand:- start:694 stop:1110 length:417 start_codon:yes stop_codon:yes gene_type:complete
MSAVKPTMLLVTSPWQGKKSFKLMPISIECPFNEGIFDSDSRILILMSKEKKDSVHMLPKLDENGDPQRIKAARPNGKTYKEHRVNLETYTEHYLAEITEIEEIINLLAINASSFDFNKYLNPSNIIMPEGKKIELIK